jgi:hypothetical protein
MGTERGRYIDFNILITACVATDYDSEGET